MRPRPARLDGRECVSCGIVQFKELGPCCTESNDLYPHYPVIDVALRGHGVERVFDSLHCAWIDVELGGDAANSFAGL